MVHNLLSALKRKGGSQKEEKEMLCRASYTFEYMDNNDNKQRESMIINVENESVQFC